MARHYLNYNKILLHHDYNSIIVQLLSLQEFEHHIIN
jgi:hypothetical protein